MCRFSAEGLSALGEFTSKKAAFLKLPCVEQPCVKPVGFVLCKESLVRLEWATCGAFITQITCALRCCCLQLSASWLALLKIQIGPAQGSTSHNKYIQKLFQAQAQNEVHCLLRYVPLGFPRLTLRWSSYDCFEWGKSHYYFIALQGTVTCQVLMAMALHQACSIPFPPLLLAALCEWQ